MHTQPLQISWHCGCVCAGGVSGIAHGLLGHAEQKGGSGWSRGTQSLAKQPADTITHPRLRPSFHKQPLGRDKKNQGARTPAGELGRLAGGAGGGDPQRLLATMAGWGQGGGMITCVCHRSPQSQRLALNIRLPSATGLGEEEMPGAPPREWALARMGTVKGWRPPSLFVPVLISERERGP